MYDENLDKGIKENRKELFQKLWRARQDIGCMASPELVNYKDHVEDYVKSLIDPKDWEKYGVKE